MINKIIVKNKIGIFCISLLGTLLFPSLLSDNSIVFSNSVFSLLFFFALFSLMIQASKQDFPNKRFATCGFILGVIFSVMIGFSHSLKAFGEVVIHNTCFIIAIILYSYILGMLINYAWVLIDTTNFNKNKHLQSALGFIFSHSYILAAFFFVCWVPCLLGIFPGGFIYDATREFYQITDGFNQNFPMLHSFIVIELLQFSFKITGEYNTGIAIYAITQMLLFAFLYTRILKEFYTDNVHPYLISAIIAYCGFFPVIPMFATYVLRDVMFGGLLSASIFLLYLMTHNPNRFFSSNVRVIETALILALTLLSRNNNAGSVVIVLVIILAIIIWFVTRNYSFKGASILSITFILSFIIISQSLSLFCSPLTSAPKGASMSIPAQQLTRAYILTGNYWSSEDISELDEYINSDVAAAEYTPEDADNTKHRLHIDDNVSNFIKFWLKIGLRYPGIYFDAALANNRQMWDPDSIIDGYNKGSTAYDNCDKCYYAYWSGIEEPGVYLNIAPNLNRFYSKIGIRLSFEKIPIISMFFSIGFQFWFVLFCLFKAIANKNRTLYLPIAIIFLYSVICAFVPLILARYFCALFLSFPMTFVFTFSKKAHD